ncbi:MAG: DUF4330 domain-containing protein [Clostridia bacterium]|nr:DUF4330 domain-containing protein [Clostridia bacterium]
MMMDEKGKLFGKINLLDLFLVLLALAVLAGAAIFFLGGGTLSAEKTIPLTYTVEIKNKDAEYFEHIKKGEQVQDGITKTYAGEIYDCSTLPATQITQADNELILSEIEGRLDGYVKIQADASVSYPDLIIGKEAVKIGKSVALRSESVAMHGYIVDITYDSDQLKEMK